MSEPVSIKVTIQPVKPNEVTLLADISRQTFFDTFHEQNTEEDMALYLEHTFNADTVQQELSAKENHFFFARIGEQIAGYLKLTEGEIPQLQTTVKALEISRIYAVKERLGTGIGKALVEFVISFAKQECFKTIWLGVWEHNQRAIQFYQRFGFEKFGEHEFMLGHDRQNDWLMKKEL